MSIPLLLGGALVTASALMVGHRGAAIAWTLALLPLGAAGHVVDAQRATLARRRTELEELAGRLEEVDAHTRQDRARLHEINATVAGIASASHLIKTLPPLRRAALVAMVEAEADRLLRVLDHGDEDQVRPVEVDVDRTVSHLVVSHRARGRQVTWTPCGLRVLGRADDLAEAVNVLLDNAGCHGSPGDIRVVARQRGSHVEIAVTDSGPGVDDTVRDRIFEWGVSRAGSPGQGIGLCAARDLMRRLSGDLSLDEGAGGARFVITLPLAGFAAPPRLARAG